MCLYIGSKSKFVAEHDITVYKKLIASGGRWVTPNRKWPIEFNKVLIPKGVAREKKCDYGYIIEEISVNAQEEITTEYEDKFIKLGNPIYKIKCMK